MSLPAVLLSNPGNSGPHGPAEGSGGLIKASGRSGKVLSSLHSIRSPGAEVAVGCSSWIRSSDIIRSLCGLQPGEGGWSNPSSDAGLRVAMTSAATKQWRWELSTGGLWSSCCL